MSFDEIQSIWNAHPDGGTAPVDEDELARQVRARHRFLARFAGLTEIALVAVLLFVTAMFLRDPLLEGHDRLLIVPGAVSLLMAVFVWTGRIARKKCELRYDSSLAGIVDQSIAAIDYQIARLRSFVWLVATPMALGLAIGLVLVDDSKRHLFWLIFIPGFVLCMGLAAWQIRRELRRTLLPERERLQALRRGID
jgi:hypothetical protein